MVFTWKAFLMVVFVFYKNLILFNAYINITSTTWLLRGSDTSSLRARNVSLLVEDVKRLQHQWLWAAVFLLLVLCFCMSCTSENRVTMTNYIRVKLWWIFIKQYFGLYTSLYTPHDQQRWQKFFLSNSTTPQQRDFFNLSRSDI